MSAGRWSALIAWWMLGAAVAVVALAVVGVAIAVGSITGRKPIRG